MTNLALIALSVMSYPSSLQQVLCVFVCASVGFVALLVQESSVLCCAVCLVALSSIDGSITFSLQVDDSGTQVYNIVASY